ncbi:MAG: DegV family protein [Chloroflexi bacterium]|nr:DegV family protein [Chloroflexota bacterium]
MTVAVVTDSTSDIPRDLAASLGIRVVPLNVHFGDEVFLDGETIKADEFYRRLESDNVFPKTSQPSAGTFADTYRELADKGATAIVSIHISSKVSGTYNSAVQARAEFGGSCPVDVVDTLQASMGLGLVVIEVARAVKGGYRADQAVSLAGELSGRARFFGLLDTLEYLHRGGRIGRAQLFLGSLLKIHPILTVQDGVAHPLERARTRSKGLARIKEITAGSAPLRSLAVMHTTEPDEAARLAEQVRQYAPGGQVVVTQFGPVLGTYLGPGALGIALIREQK